MSQESKKGWSFMNAEAPVKESFNDFENEESGELLSEKIQPNDIFVSGSGTIRRVLSKGENGIAVDRFSIDGDVSQKNMSFENLDRSVSSIMDIIPAEIAEPLGAEYQKRRLDLVLGDVVVSKSGTRREVIGVENGVYVIKRTSIDGDVSMEKRTKEMIEKSIRSVEYVVNQDEQEDAEDEIERMVLEAMRLNPKKAVNRGPIIRLAEGNIYRGNQVRYVCEHAWDDFENDGTDGDETPLAGELNQDDPLGDSQSSKVA